MLYGSGLYDYMITYECVFSEIVIDVNQTEVVICNAVALKEVMPYPVYQRRDFDQYLKYGEVPDGYFIRQDRYPVFWSFFDHFKGVHNGVIKEFTKRLMSVYCLEYINKACTEICPECQISFNKCPSCNFPSVFPA